MIQGNEWRRLKSKENNSSPNSWPRVSALELVDIRQNVSRADREKNWLSDPTHGHELVKTGESFRDFSAISVTGFQQCCPTLGRKGGRIRGIQQEIERIKQERKEATTGVKRRTKESRRGSRASRFKHQIRRSL